MPSSLHSVTMSKSMTCSKLPPFREKLCWVRWGHWCKGWHLNKKHIPGAGWHFLYTYQIRGLSRAHQASPPCPPSYSQLTDGNSCKEAGWVPGREECHHLQQMPLSPSRAVLPQLQQRCYTSGNNSHVLGDHAVRITVNWLWERYNCVLGSARTLTEWNKSL